MRQARSKPKTGEKCKEYCNPNTRTRREDTTCETQTQMNDNIKMDVKISKMGQRAPDSSGSWQE